jgi:hypothetical protein
MNKELLASPFIAQTESGQKSVQDSVSTASSTSSKTKFIVTSNNNGRKMMKIKRDRQDAVVTEDKKNDICCGKCQKPIHEHMGGTWSK